MSGGGRPSAESRAASLVIASLMVTPDAGLSRFRERRCEDKELDEDHLRVARDILRAIHAAIEDDGPEAWARIQRAHAVLREPPVQPSSLPPPVHERPSSLPPPLVGHASSLPPPLVGHASSLPPPPIGHASSLPPPVHERPSSLPPPLVGHASSLRPPPTVHAHRSSIPPAMAAIPPQPLVPAAPPPAAITTARSQHLNHTMEMPALPDLTVDDPKALPFAGERKSGSTAPAEDPTLLPLTADVEVEAGPPLPQHVAVFDLAKYAALCAECAVDPAAISAVRARHGLAKADHAAIDNHWRARMDGDAALRAEFTESYLRHEKLLKTP